MKYHAILANLFALLSVFSIGLALIFTLLGEPSHAMFACALCLMFGLLHCLHRKLAVRERLTLRR